MCIFMMNFFILCSTSFTLQAYQVTLSFDSLFPITWYQKGLEASLHVWQELVDIFNNNGNDDALSYDSLLGKLVFAQFCVNRMIQENGECVPEDISYFVTVLNKLQSLLAMVVVTSKTEDFILCAVDMIQSTLSVLSSLTYKLHEMSMPYVPPTTFVLKTSDPAT